MTRSILAAAIIALLSLAPVPASALQIYVSNEKDNTVTVIDGNTLKVIKTIPTARRLRGIIASPDGKEVYVAAGDGDIMDVIDTKKLEVVRQLDSGPDPELMAVDPKGGTLYIANEDDSMVTVMDTASGDVLAEIPVGVEPEGMGVSPDSKYTGRHLGKHEHGPCHRQRASSSPTCWSIRGRARRSSRQTATRCGFHRRSAAPSR
jgi:YVTN family beta-propeller protein